MVVEKSVAFRKNEKKRTKKILFKREQENMFRMGYCVCVYVLQKKAQAEEGNTRKYPI